MSKVVITIEDSGGEINLKIDFGAEGINEESHAHAYGAEAFSKLVENIKDAWGF